MLASPVPNLQTSIPSLNKSTTSHPVIPIPDFTISFVYPEKENDNTLEKSDSSKVDTYIDWAYDKSKFVNLGKEILQSLQKDVNMFDNEFYNFKSRCVDQF